MVVNIVDAYIGDMAIRFMGCYSRWTKLGHLVPYPNSLMAVEGTGLGKDGCMGQLAHRIEEDRELGNKLTLCCELWMEQAAASSMQKCRFSPHELSD